MSQSLQGCLCDPCSAHGYGAWWLGEKGPKGQESPKVIKEVAKGPESSFHN